MAQGLASSIDAMMEADRKARQKGLVPTWTKSNATKDGLEALRKDINRQFIIGKQAVVPIKKKAPIHFGPVKSADYELEYRWLKEVWDSDAVHKQFYAENPFLTTVTKENEMATTVREMTPKQLRKLAKKRQKAVDANKKRLKARKAADKQARADKELALSTFRDLASDKAKPAADRIAAAKALRGESY